MPFLAARRVSSRQGAPFRVGDLAALLDQAGAGSCLVELRRHDEALRPGAATSVVTAGRSRADGPALQEDA